MKKQETITSGMTITEAVDWYSQNRKIYKQLSQKVHNIIHELLDINNINIHAIFNRTKDIDSFRDKITDPKYTNPKEQITDLTGIRIICYVESDLDLICKVVEDNFEIDEPNSGDKSKLLGTDKVGYKSIHYVATLKSDRIALPEYKKFENHRFEIQIRTILQHAWAEIEHDRDYKFSGELPDSIKRRFKLIAGTLELADREFNSIALEIDKINLEVEKGTKEGNLNFEINTTTLKQFLATKFHNSIPKLLTPGFPDTNSEYKILEELQKFGLNKLKDLNEIIPSDFESSLEKFPTNHGRPYTYPGILRGILMIADWKKYFEKSYTRDWGAFATSALLENYSVPIEKIKQKYILI